MRARTNIPERSAEPGPGNYSISATVGPESHPVASNAPVWQFGSTERDKAHGRIDAHIADTPSPGQYNVTRDERLGRVDHEAVPSFSMRAKTQDMKDPEYRQKVSPR